MLAIDIIKPEAKTEREEYLRYLSSITSKVLSMPGVGRKIEVIDQDALDYWAGVHSDSKADAEHARQEDEAIQDLR